MRKKQVVDVDAVELKRQQKAAADAAAAAEAVEEDGESEEDRAEAKRKRKAAKKRAAATAVEPEAKKAAKAAEGADEEEEAEAPAKKKTKVAEAEPAKAGGGDSFKVFLGGLAWHVDEAILLKDFKECGEIVEIKLVKDPETGNSKGIAFITMADQAGFDAVMKFNGEDYAGRPLSASKAHDKTKVAEAEPAKAGSDSFKAFIGGLAWHVDEAILRKDFMECGEILELKLVMDPETGKSKGIAFITMADQAGFDAVMKFNGEDYGGRLLSISKANDKTGGGGGSKGKDDKGKGKGKGKDKGKDKGKEGKGKGKDGPTEKPAGCKGVCVKGLGYEVTEEDVQEFFVNCQEKPVSVKMLYDPATGKSKGTAFITFEGTDAVDEGMKLSDTPLKGRKFFMQYSAAAAPKGRK